MEGSNLLITSTLIFQVWLQLVAGQDYVRECSAWDDAVARLNHADEEMVMTCTRNKQCTGADCVGSYQYQELFQYTKKEVDYCFGVALHPCRNPTELHFYVETPHNNQTYQKNVTTYDTSYDTGIGLDVRGGHASLYIQVGVNHTRRNNKKYMEIEMRSKVRVRALGFIDQWPENHQKVLIPPILVPVPDCNPRVVTPNYSPGTCMAPKSSVAPPTQNASHTGKSCKQVLKDGTYDANVCGQGELCEEGFCRCLMNYIQVNDSCIPGHSTVIPFLITDGPVSGHAKNTATIMIVVGVAIVAFLLMLAVGFFILKYRRYKARYGNHQRLNEDDNNAPDDLLDEEVDDDPPLDLST